MIKKVLFNFNIIGWNVVRKISLFSLILVIFLAGCKSDQLSQRDIEDTRTRQIESYTNVVIKSIQQKNLAYLESIEPWQNVYGPGLRITTAHYEIYATLINNNILTNIPAFLESAFQAYNSQLPEPIETSNKFTMYLFSDRTQWEHFTWTFAGDQAQMFYKIKAGAYCHNGTCVAYDIGLERTMSALAHEGWHQFSSRHFKYRLPSWLDEGVAMLFETFSYKDGRIVFEPGKNQYRINSLRKTLENKNTIPLYELTAINPGQVLAIDQSDAVAAFYSQSYALVRFLREYSNNQYRNAYNQLLTDGLLGNWQLDEVSKEIAIDRNMPRTILWNHLVGTQLFRQYINEDFQKVEQEYLAFCRMITQN